MMQQFDCLKEADAICLQHAWVLFAVKPQLVLHADGWQAPTGICPLPSVCPTEAEWENSLEQRGAKQQPSRFLLLVLIPHHGTQAPGECKHRDIKHPNAASPF